MEVIGCTLNFSMLAEKKENNSLFFLRFDGMSRINKRGKTKQINLGSSILKSLSKVVDPDIGSGHFIVRCNPVIRCTIDTIKIHAVC